MLQLICLVSMLGSFLKRTKKELQLLKHFKKQFQKEENQIHQGGEFYSKLFKRFLKISNIKTY